MIKTLKNILTFFQIKNVDVLSKILIETQYYMKTCANKNIIPTKNSQLIVVYI